MTDNIDKALYLALTRTGSAENRWAIWRRRGLTDAEIQQAIGFEFGISGGIYSGDIACSFKGGDIPAFWFGSSVSTTTPPTFKGSELVKAARRVMQIPGVGQRSLFEVMKPEPLTDSQLEAQWYNRNMGLPYLKNVKGLPSITMRNAHGLDKKGNKI